MICGDLDPWIQPYVDGEFSPEDAQDLEAHLTSCPSCDARVRQERQERQALRERLRTIQAVAPAAVRASVQAAFRRERRRAAAAQITKWGSVTLAVAAATTATLSLRTPEDEQLREEAAMRHARRLPLEVQAPANLETWFDGKLRHPVRLPHLANATLSGGRLSHLSDRDAAYVAYDASPAPGAPAHRVGLFVLESESDPGGLNRSDIRIIPAHGYNVATWDGDGLRYQLVTDLDESEIRRMVGDPTPSTYSVQPASLQLH